MLMSFRLLYCLSVAERRTVVLSFLLLFFLFSERERVDDRTGEDRAGGRRAFSSLPLLLLVIERGVTV